MNRRDFLATTGTAAGALMLPFDQLQLFLKAQPGDFTMKELRKNVGIFTERGGTIVYRATPGGVVVVDTQFPDQAKNLINDFKSKDLRKIDLVINTHHHGDHTGGNIAFKKVAKSFVAHENSVANQMRVAEERGTKKTQLYPETTFKDTWSTEIDGETIKLHYFGAAHTNGDSMVHFENANVVHMGDLVFNRMHPYIDTSAGADVSNWIQVLDKAVQTFDDDTIFVFGHSHSSYEVTGEKKDLIAFRDYLDTAHDIMMRNVGDYDSVEEFIKDFPQVPGSNEWQGDGIERTWQPLWEKMRAEE